MLERKASICLQSRKTYFYIVVKFRHLLSLSNFYNKSASQRNTINFIIKSLKFQNRHLMALILSLFLTLAKTKRKRKWTISPTFIQRRTLCFNSNKNRKLKIKTVNELKLAKEKIVRFFWCFFHPIEIFVAFVYYLDV